MGGIRMLGGQHVLNTAIAITLFRMKGRAVSHSRRTNLIGRNPGDFLSDFRSVFRAASAYF